MPRTRNSGMKSIMNIKILVVGLLVVVSYVTLAMERIGFSCKLPDDRMCAFGCDLYSVRKTGMMKMMWFPSVACQVDSPTNSRTSKVWSMMPLRKIVPGDGLWHCSQRPGTIGRELSARYSVGYFAASAEGDELINVGHVFDMDAGDVFQWFGRSPRCLLTSLLLAGDDSPPVIDLDRVLCSSGRIGLNGGRVVLLYGLTLIANGECWLTYTVNGLGDVGRFDFYCKDGKVYNSRGDLIEARPYVHTSRPALSIRISDPETISICINSDCRLLMSGANSEDDIHISLPNLVSIVEWLSKPEGVRGSWQAGRECSLKARRIF